VCLRVGLLRDDQRQARQMRLWHGVGQSRQITGGYLSRSAQNPSSGFQRRDEIRCASCVLCNPCPRFTNCCLPPIAPT
jgi:hypothetical protein